MLSHLPVALALASLARAATLPSPILATYWGQSTESSLSTYCATGYFNVISIGYVSGFGATTFAFSTDGCTSTATSGSCAALGKEIQTCQAAGVKILVSYGGATKFDCGSSGCTGDYYFSSAAQAETTATQAWEMFFNSGKVTSGVARPFGEGVTLDGVDLDIEMTATGDGQSNQLYYDSFASTLKGLDSGLIVSAAPECQYGALGSNPMATIVTSANLDFLFVQFFNNAVCEVSSSNFAAAFAFWVSQAAANPNGATQVLLGLPGNTDAALTAQYYLTPAETLSNVTALRATYPSANVGVGVWDAAASTGSNDWAQTVAKGLANLPVVVASSSGAVASAALASVVGNTTSSSHGSSSSSGKAASTAAVKTTAGVAAVSGASSSSGASASASASASGAAGRMDTSSVLVGLGAAGALAAWVC